MRKKLILLFLAVLFSSPTVKCAQASEPSKQITSILKKKPSATKKKVHFPEKRNQTLYDKYALKREQTTLSDKEKIQRRVEFKRQGRRAILPAITKANEDWRTTDDFMTKSEIFIEAMILDLKNRMEKLEVLTQALEIEKDSAPGRFVPTPVTSSDHSIPYFMKLAAMPKEEFELLFTDYFLNALITHRPYEMECIISSIIDTLIDEERIDTTFKKTSLCNKMAVLHQEQAFHPQAFQILLNEFLEKYDYAFPEQPAAAAAAVPPLAGFEHNATFSTSPSLTAVGAMDSLFFDDNDNDYNLSFSEEPARAAAAAAPSLTYPQ